MLVVNGKQGRATQPGAAAQGQPGRGGGGAPRGTAGSSTYSGRCPLHPTTSLQPLTNPDVPSSCPK